MPVKMLRLVTGLACVPLTLTVAFAQQTQHLSFVACPVIIDTELPCWLADYEGKTYFLGTQGDSASAFYSPQLRHKMLVEARIAGEDPVCGGIPLAEVRISVFHEIDDKCNEIRSGEGVVPPPFSRGPGPALRPHSPTPRVDPVAPFVERTWTIELEFDSEFLARRNTAQLEAIARYVELSGHATVEITGSRGSSLLSNGTIIVEQEDIGERRARRVNMILKDLGVPSENIEAGWSTTPTTPDGRTDPSRRIVTIKVKPK